MLKNFDALLKQVKEKPSRRLAVAGAENAEALSAVARAQEENIAEATLFGSRAAIEKTAAELKVDLTLFEVVDTSSPADAAAELVGSDNAAAMMKGGIPTKQFLRAVLNEKYGLRTGRLLSHVMIAQLPAYHKLLFLTDAAMNIAPGLKEKADLIRNAVEVVRTLGIEQPKVAALAAVEKVNLPAMPATGDAAALAVMGKRGQLGSCLVDGPLALDNAISAQSAKIKKIKSDVAGDADILLCPDIEAANVLYKAFTYLANAKAGAVIVGAACPIILPSRADDSETKFLSIACALS